MFDTCPLCHKLFEEEDIVVCAIDEDYIVQGIVHVRCIRETATAHGLADKGSGIATNNIGEA